jgi:subtilisin
MSDEGDGTDGGPTGETEPGTGETETGTDGDGEETPVDVEGVGDSREKFIRVMDVDGETHEHGDVYVRHADDVFLVSPDPEFPPGDTTRYAKAASARVEIKQHHAACFITTAAAGEGATLDALRGFRDDALAATPVGRGLVRVYYAVSPPVADTLARHPESRTAGLVRGLVERCASIARRRAESDAPAARFGLSVALTCLYVVGLAAAVAGHAWIRAREVAASR